MKLLWLAAVACCAFVAGANAQAVAKDTDYPTKSIRFIVPFAEGGAPGLVSRRPVRGQGAHAAGFYTVADTPPPYPTKPVRFVVPFAEGDASGLVSRRPVRGQDAQAAGFYAVAATISPSYPSKSIRFIVPFAPGGGTDIIGRIVAQLLHEALGQPVVVDNRAGAGSSVGTEIAARAHASSEQGSRLRDANVRESGAALSNPTASAASVSGVTSPKGAPVPPYDGAPPDGYTLLLGNISLAFNPALTDVIGGQVHMMVSTFASALPHVKSGRLRALGVTSAKRSSATPDIPTLMEVGVPGYDYSTWYGLLVPARTPRAIVDQLHRTTLKVLAQDDAKRKLEAQGVETITNTPAEFSAYLKSETAKWSGVVRVAGITPQ